MTYHQLAIAAGPNPGGALQTALESALTSEGWMPDHDASVGTRRARVYLSPGSSNKAGYDWYLAIMWDTVGTGFFRVAAGEELDTPNELLLRAATGWNNAGPTPGAASGDGSMGADGATWGAIDLLSTSSTLTPIGPGAGTTTGVGGLNSLPTGGFTVHLGVTLDVVTGTFTAPVNPSNSHFLFSTLDTGYPDTHYGEFIGPVSNTPLLGTWKTSGSNMTSLVSSLWEGPTPTGSAGRSCVLNSTVIGAVPGPSLPALTHYDLHTSAWPIVVTGGIIAASTSGADYRNWPGPTPPSDGGTSFPGGLAGPTTGGRVIVGTANDVLLIAGGSRGDSVDVTGLGRYVKINDFTGHWVPGVSSGTHLGEIPLGDWNTAEQKINATAVWSEFGQRWPIGNVTFGQELP